MGAATMDGVWVKALERLDTQAEELAKEKPAMKLAGQMLTDFVTARPRTAKYFADETKSLGEGYKKVEEAARKKQKGGAYCMSDAEFMDLILDYYGVKDKERTASAAEPKSKKAEPRVDVGDLLEGL